LESLIEWSQPRNRGGGLTGFRGVFLLERDRVYMSVRETEKACHVVRGECMQPWAVKDCEFVKDYGRRIVLG
jgi:hypothetical protein